MSRRRIVVAAFAAITAVALLVAPGVAAATPGYLTQWGSHGAADGQLDTPLYMASNGLNAVYVIDCNNARVQYFSLTGAFMGKWSADGGTGFAGPEGICVNRLGQVIVTDAIKGRVTEYSATGGFIRVIGTGSSGSGNGEFKAPYDVATDRFGFIYVADAENNRIQKFFPDGTYLSQWGTLGGGPGQLNFPVGIAVDSLGYVYVVDYFNTRIQKFTSSGDYVTQWGSLGSADGQLNGPGPISIGQDGNLYVAEYYNNRVQVFSPDGAFLFKWGMPGTGNGQFTEPWGVCSDGTGIYVSEENGDRIQKFTLASAKRTTRVGGADRYDVAVNLVGARWPGLKGIKHVIVVCGEDRANADPLAASGLAGIYDAPILMTKTSGLTGSTFNMLKAINAVNGPVAIHVVGGTTSIPKAVYNKIATTNPGGTIERISGADRYELSAKMAIRLKAVADAKGIPVPGVLLFNGQNSKAFYDALAAGPLSAGGQVPMMALRNDGVPGSVKSVLDTTLAGKPRLAISSTTYIPASVYTAAGCAGRLANTADRNTAAWQLSAWGRLFGWVGLKNISLANKLPDSLTGGAFVGQQGGILLYTDKAALPTITNAAVGIVKIGSQQGWVFGGPASVADSAIAQFNTALNTP